MTIKGGLRIARDASWGLDDVVFDDAVVEFEAQVAWPHNDTMANRQADCRNTPTKRCP
jgi:hypothetical protein